MSADAIRARMNAWNWNGMNAVDQREALMGAFRDVVDVIDAQGRGLSPWQDHHLCSALSSVAVGWHRLAGTHIWLALEPEQGISPSLRWTPAAQSNVTTIDDLRRNAAYVDAMPLGRFAARP